MDLPADLFSNPSLYILSWQQDNPKRLASKSHKTYEKYKDSENIENAFAKGATQGDIKRGFKNGILSIKRKNECIRISGFEVLDTSESDVRKDAYVPKRRHRKFIKLMNKEPDSHDGDTTESE